MKIAIFSDLHLQRDRPDGARLFEDLLLRLGEENPGPGNELWLLGDIFDLMIGPFLGWTKLYPGIFTAFRKLKTQGWRLLWIQGNHDFHLEKLLESLGIEHSDSEIVRTVAGKRIYLAHGDLVNLADHKYLKWRSWTRSPRFLKLLNWVHRTAGVRGIEKIGNRYSRRSRKRLVEIPDSEITREIYRDFARKKWAEGYSLVLLGHSHIEENFTENEGHYLNLGSWINYSPRYALWDPEQDNFPKRLLS
jgi:UDP-2,3-diacylglucosamine hydrolase